MGMTKQIYFGTYIKAKIKDSFREELIEADEWFAPFDENGSKDLKDRTIWIPNKKEIIKIFGGAEVGDFESGVYEMKEENKSDTLYWLGKFTAISEKPPVLRQGLVIWWS